MALSVTINGVVFSIPETSETGYGTSLDSYLKAIATAFLPLGGGVQSLTAELDLGATFGIKSAWFKSRTTNPAVAGALRLAKTDSIGIRNNANGADLALGIDTLDGLTFGGQNVTGNPMLDATTVAGQTIPTGATETIVVFGTATTDTDTGLNTGTGRYTVPAGKGGHYLLTGQIAYAPAPTGTCTASLFKNAALLKTTLWIAPGAAQTIQISAIVLLAAADVIDLRTKHGNGAGQALTTTAGQNYLALKRITS